MEARLLAAAGRPNAQVFSEMHEDDRFAAEKQRERNDGARSEENPPRSTGVSHALIVSKGSPAYGGERCCAGRLRRLWGWGPALQLRRATS